MSNWRGIHVCYRNTSSKKHFCTKLSGSRVLPLSHETLFCFCLPFKQKNRDFASCFLLKLSIVRKHCDRLLKGLLPLSASQQSRRRLKRFVPNLNRDIG